MLARVERHPLIEFRCGAEVTGLNGTGRPVRPDPTGPVDAVRVHARIGGETQSPR